jgi:hypothetical protein
MGDEGVMQTPVSFLRLTPRRIVGLCRVAAAACGIGLAGLMLGPFQGLEQAFGLSDTAAHAIAFFAAATGLFLVAPGWRRGDIAIGAVAFGVVIELLQGLTGRSMSITDVMADVLGVGVALIPGTIERLRWMARAHPDLTLAEIAARDRRVARRREKARPVADVAR